MRRGGAWLVWLVLVLWSAGLWAKTVHYYYTDPQGTVLAKTDASGHILVRSDYRPYGRPVQAQGTLPAGPGYTGHVNDPDTGLVYMQARYYDPEARMLSVDPVAPTPGDVYNFNRYTYVNGNPLRYNDPTGMCSAPNVPDPICEKPRSQPHDPKPEVSPEVQRMRNTSDHGGIFAAVKDRSSFTAEGGAAFGPGVSASATKQVGNSPDSIKGSFVIGEGAMAGAMYNFKLFSSKREASSGISFTGDPSSYFKVKVGLGLALGMDVSLDPHGAWELSVSIGGGLGEEVLYKPPVTVGGVYNIGE